MLARIDERTQRIDSEVSIIREALENKYVTRETHAALAVKVDEVTKSNDKAHADFVTVEQFFLVRALVFGCAGLMLVAVVGALIATVIVQKAG